MQDLLADLDLAVSAAYKAGELIKVYKENGFQTLEDKDDGDPALTEVDLAVDAFLHRTLLEQTPDYGWISEENSTENKNQQHDRVWHVDPIDGTKCLIAGLDTFVISIGLVEYGCPVLGVIYNPLRGQMFSCVKGHGVFLNNERMYSLSQNISDSLLLLPMGGLKNPDNKDLINSVGQFEEVGSIAYRMALVAAGQADLTFVDHEVASWDIAAGMTMLEEQGFQILEPNGKEVDILGCYAINKIAHDGFFVVKEGFFD